MFDNFSHLCSTIYVFSRCQHSASRDRAASRITEPHDKRLYRMIQNHDNMFCLDRVAQTPSFSITRSDPLALIQFAWPGCYKNVPGKFSRCSINPAMCIYNIVMPSFSDPLVVKVPTREEGITKELPQQPMTWLCARPSLEHVIWCARLREIPTGKDVRRTAQVTWHTAPSVSVM